MKHAISFDQDFSIKRTKTLVTLFKKGFAGKNNTAPQRPQISLAIPGPGYPLNLPVHFQ